MSEPQPTTSEITAAAAVSEEDTHFKRRIGWVMIAFMTFSGMVGSGWLFASYYAGTIAGPLALASWIIAAVATALVGLTFVNLGVTRPIAGGNSRWPSMISGPFVGIMVSWVIFVSAALGTPSEASAMVIYASYWWPALVENGSPTVLGLFVAALVLVFFTFLNWFGVVLLARINALITVFKIAVPLLTVVLLIATGFDSRNFGESGGGFAPYGSAAMLTAIIGAGLIYSFGGIQIGAIMAGEAKRPRRDIPVGTFVGFGAAFVLYMGLQFSFLGAVPNDLLAEVGWHGLNFDSPLAHLAMLLNLGWLTQLLLVDALVSPGGALLLGLGTQARSTYGIAQTRVLPRWAARVHAGSGIPRNALVVNLVISLVFLFTLQSWHALVAALGMFFAVGYAIIAVAAGASEHDPKLSERPYMRGMSVIAPISFIVSALVMYWAGWNQVMIALILFSISILIFLFLMSRDRKILTTRVLVGGLWFPVFMAFIGVMSFIGGFGGQGLITGPWDSIVVGAGALVFYFWGHSQSVKWVTSPEAELALGKYS